MGVFPPAWAQFTISPPSYMPIREAPSHSVRIAVDMTKRSTAQGDFGVACGGPSSQFPYGALVDVGGSWRLVRNRDRAPPIDIRSGTEAGVMAGAGPHRIVLECIGQGETISMTLWVDGIEVATATAPRGTAFGPGPALILDPTTSPVDVLFDNLEVTYS
jgi:hypothetical protein